MPIYEYECNACGEQHEFIQKFSEGPKRKCPACGRSRLRKLMSAAAFHLKGSGWYVTDFRDGDKKKPADGEDSAKSAGDASSESAAGSESKSESGDKSTDKPQKAAEGKSQSKSESKSGSKSPAKKEKTRSESTQR
jgi:putative FmdB family regulatory protein